MTNGNLSRKCNSAYTSAAEFYTGGRFGNDHNLPGCRGTMPLVIPASSFEMFFRTGAHCCRSRGPIGGHCHWLVDLSYGCFLRRLHMTLIYTLVLTHIRFFCVSLNINQHTKLPIMLF